VLQARLAHLQQAPATAGALLGAILDRQSTMRAMLDPFLLPGWSVLATLPLLLFMGRGAPRPGAAVDIGGE